jgi:hypothetical protein
MCLLQSLALQTETKGSRAAYRPVRNNEMPQFGEASLVEQVAKTESLTDEGGMALSRSPVLGSRGSSRAVHDTEAPASVWARCACQHGGRVPTSSYSSTPVTLLIWSSRRCVARSTNTEADVYVLRS